jgi:hypothetical protein
VAAAVADSREGLRVTLVEHHGFGGWLAVAGMSGTICDRYAAHESPDRAPARTRDAAQRPV